MIGDIADPRVADAIGSAFGGVAGEMRGRADRSREREAEGQRGTREDTYTDILIDEMGGRLAEGIAERLRAVVPDDFEAEIEFHATNFPVGEECKYGADIGIRTTIRTPHFFSVKGVLIQCKRMFPSPAASQGGSFPELRGRGERQAEDMLRITPASFFMLFNSGPQSWLIDTSGVPAGTICPMDGPIPHPKRGRLGSSCPYWANSHGGIWDMGIALIPASRVLALSAAASTAGAQFPIDAATVLQGALPFGVFMTDLLAGCFVGDVREAVVRLTTPPHRRRDAELGLGPDDPFRGFAIRRYLDINLSSTPEGRNVRR